MKTPFRRVFKDIYMQLKKIIGRAYAWVIPALIACVSTGFTQCTDSDGEEIDPTVEVVLQKEIAGPMETSQFIDVKASGSWTLSLEFEYPEDEENPVEWCRLKVGDRSGNGDKSSIVLSYDTNELYSDRVVYLVLRSGEAESRAKFIQEGTNMGNSVYLLLRSTRVPANDISQLVRVVCDGSWEITLEYPEGGASDWATITPTEGVGDKDDILLTYSENEDMDNDRRVTLILKSGSQTVSSTLTQLKKTGAEEEILDVELSKEDVEATETSQTVNVKCSGAWTLAIEYGSGASGWATLGTSSGTGNQTVTLNYSTNTSENARTATLVVTSVASGKTDRSATLTQKGKQVVVVPTGWLELPDMSNMAANTKFVTHNTTINGKSVRNFSMLYDTNERIAYWVAYPHHSSYMGSTRRTDAWQYDPKIPTNQQANLSSSYVDNDYDRGHQIPSADRTATRAANEQTFYYTNMTPQKGKKFNQSIWANLEDDVRGWLGGSDKPDTLYVVTGAILKTRNGNETVNYAKDRSGTKVAKPNYYFKVLLHRKNNNYRTIGFWYENRDYTYTQPVKSDIKTVREIENLTGFNFFANLPQATQDQIEDVVTYSAWGF